MKLEDNINKLHDYRKTSVIPPHDYGVTYLLGAEEEVGKVKVHKPNPQSYQQTSWRKRKNGGISSKMINEEVEKIIIPGSKGGVGKGRKKRGRRRGEKDEVAVEFIGGGKRN